MRAFYDMAKRRWPFHSAEMKWLKFHSGQNEINVTSVWPKWDVHFGQNEMEFLSFQPKFCDHFVLVKIKWILFYSGRIRHLILPRIIFNSFHFGRNEMALIFFNFLFARIILLINMRLRLRLSSSSDSEGGFELEKTRQLEQYRMIHSRKLRWHYIWQEWLAWQHNETV